ncbi:unnamed protein product [Rhizophagus irregularis]|nr:unnamed protein product [Rhizophagus irregularis]
MSAWKFSMDEREVTPELSQISILDSHIGIRFWYIWMRENSGGQVSGRLSGFEEQKRTKTCSAVRVQCLRWASEEWKT